MPGRPVHPPCCHHVRRALKPSPPPPVHSEGGGAEGLPPAQVFTHTADSGVPHLPHSSRVKCMAVSPLGGHLVTGDEHGLLRVWAMRGLEVEPIELPGRASGYLPREVGMLLEQDSDSPGGGAGDARGGAGPAGGGALRAKVQAHKQEVTDTAFNNAGDRFLTSSMRDGTVRVRAVQRPCDPSRLGPHTLPPPTPNLPRHHHKLTPREADRSQLALPLVSMLIHAATGLDLGAGLLLAQEHDAGGAQRQAGGAAVGRRRQPQRLPRVVPAQAAQELAEPAPGQRGLDARRPLHRHLAERAHHRGPPRAGARPQAAGQGGSAGRPDRHTHPLRSPNT
jgi:hypothetical protein